jgi:hypothetical protein
LTSKGAILVWLWVRPMVRSLLSDLMLAAAALSKRVDMVKPLKE